MMPILAGSCPPLGSNLALICTRVAVYTKRIKEFQGRSCWRYRPPEHMLRLVCVALCAQIDWAKAHMGHVNHNYGKVAEIATKHQPLGLFTPIVLQWCFLSLGSQITKNHPIWCSGWSDRVLVVKTRVHAAAD
eukprot:1155891-Pelagomonas_calceolata.AAC.5